MRVLVVCPVHDPRDARIAEREIPALLAAGHDVTQAGPFTAVGAIAQPGVRPIDIPRSVGRKRARAVHHTRRMLREQAPHHDIVLLHSPDAVIAASGLDHAGIVWDVHEDTAAAVGTKPWLPRALAAPAAWSIRAGEAWAERNVHLLLAEHSYADRFARSHPVVPNSVFVPDAVPRPERGRVVYLGSVTRARGARELIEVGRLLADGPAIRVDVIGGAGPEVLGDVEVARDRGWIAWHGYVKNSVALSLVDGATAGLSLLHDEPNYRHSMPTKLLEYLAHGVPFVSTPLPLAVELAEVSGGGIIVPFGDLGAAYDAIVELNADDDRRQKMADIGREWVRANANWAIDGAAFIRQLEEWARG